MRKVRVLLLVGTASVWPSGAFAADALKQGAPPPWVVRHTIPTLKDSEAPVQVLLEDEQVGFERGKVTIYTDQAMKVQNSQGLTAGGNVSIVWQPATDTVTVNRLDIIRAGKVIDVLAGGQSFTVLRRETNLDAATLDGTLTATIQPEGLQVGDVIDLATTTERSDPVLKGHVEAMFGAWDGIPIGLANASLQLPSNLRVNVRQTADLPRPKRNSTGGLDTLELTATDVQPLVPPKGAPGRFTIGRFAEASDFSSWADLADLMLPLYQTASAIPASGPLHDEVEKIRAGSADPNVRAAQALALVQDRVRYVALLMGQGGYVPATAEQTWSRRFGDCKAKTALLLGILRSLGIQAEPVLVQTKLGDMIADRLPMIALFNHVLVRAHIAGKDYWLDGTRTGDTSLETIEIPDFGWGLPLIKQAQLVHLVPRPLQRPSYEQLVDIDASGGVYADAPITIEEVYRGDTAVALNALYSAASSDQRDQAAHEKATGYFDGFDVKSSKTRFDKAANEFDLTIKGSAKLSWKDGWFYVPASSIGFDPDFERPAGPHNDVPVSVGYPIFVAGQTTIHLPLDFASEQQLKMPIHETLAGVEYTRAETVAGNVVTVKTTQRSLVPEIAYKDALAAEPRLRALDKEDIYLNLPKQYAGTDLDLQTLRAATPASAQDYFIRAYLLARRGKMTEAKADFDAGLLLDPNNGWALKERAALAALDQHFSEADKDLAKAGSMAPEDAEILAVRGALAMSRGDLAAASAAFDQALARDPKMTRALLGRATILMMQDKQDEALREITIALAGDPKNGGALALRAKVLENRNDYAGADRDIAAALASEPNNAVILSTRASIAADRKDYATAKQFVARSLAIEPNNPFARALQAQLDKRSGGDAADTAALDAAITGAPGDPAPRINRAIMRLQAKDYVGADEDVDAALAIEPGNRRALRLRAGIQTLQGDFAGEVATLTTLLKDTPSDSTILAARADAYRSLHKLDLAMADITVATKVGPVSPQLRLLKINLLISKGDITAVRPETDALALENPTSDFAQVAAAKVYARLGERDKAMASFSRALALKPLAYIYINRSQIRPHGDVQGKLADLDAALKLEPDNETTLSQKAWVFSEAGRNAEAIDLYDRAIKIALDPSYLKLWRGIALARAGRTSEARSVIEGQRADAKTAGDFSNLCRAQASAGVLLQSALQDCRHAALLDSHYPNLNDNLGLVLLKLGKLHDALAAYDQALSEDVGAGTSMERAIVHQRLGQWAAAQSDAARARALDAEIDDRMADEGLTAVPAAGAPGAAIAARQSP